VCGEDAEGVELYPDERRLVDAANNYHLWAFPDKLTFGFGIRAVADGSHAIPGCAQTQSPFGADRPADCVDVSACRTWDDVLRLLPGLAGERGGRESNPQPESPSAST
jgi:hypothetical protein